MALVDWESFGEEKVTRVYLASKLREAKRVEGTLSSHGIDYAVEIEPFITYLFGIIRREHKGVAFYVQFMNADLSRQKLEEVGLVRGLVDDADSDSELNP